MLKLLPGLHVFKTEIHAANKDFFEELARSQSPDAVFITCSDSRVVVSLLTQTNPGDLFHIRNAGNIIPPHGTPVSGEEATLEFAVNALNVKDIIVCGHSGCGAMKGLLAPESLENLPCVAQWLQHSAQTKELIDKNYADLDFECKHNIAIQENVLVQLEHLRTYPFISKKLWKREINLHGWVYDIETGEVYIYNPIDEEFQPMHQFTDMSDLHSQSTV